MITATGKQTRAGMFRVTVMKDGRRLSRREFADEKIARLYGKSYDSNFMIKKKA